MPGGHAASCEVQDRLLELLCIVLDEGVHKAGFVTLLATHQAPDQLLVAGVQLVDARLLLDHLRAVQLEPRLREGHQISAQPGRNRHAAKTADHAGDDPDDGHVPPQGNDLGMDLADHGLAEVGLLQANAARLEQKHRQDRLAALAIAPCEGQCGRDLARRHLPHAAALERALDRHDHGGPAGHLSACNDNAVIRLGHDSLERKPG